jgi:hypothetical protein
MVLKFPTFYKQAGPSFEPFKLSNPLLIRISMTLLVQGSCRLQQAVDSTSQRLDVLLSHQNREYLGTQASIEQLAHTQIKAQSPSQNITVFKESINVL